MLQYYNYSFSAFTENPMEGMLGSSESLPRTSRNTVNKKTIATACVPQAR